MELKFINLYEVENNVRSIITAIDEGYTFVSKFDDGEVCLFINKKGKERELKAIMYNQNSGAVRRFEITKGQFKVLFNDAISKFGIENYKVSDCDFDVIEQFDSITHALCTERTGECKGRRVKRIGISNVN